MLPGRGAECAQLDGLLEAVRGGASRTLVIRGEPGVGKTALLDYLAGHERFRICRISGVQSEMELAFAGLHQLCAPLADLFGHLPGLQRDALRGALGLGSGQVPNRFLVGLATLGLLAEAAHHEPLIWLVDDAQWLDQASLEVLAFTARRLLAESVAIVFAARLPDEAPELAGLPELVVGGLPDDAARTLLRSVLPGLWDEQVVDRIIAEARGNPLALLELPKESFSAELAGGFGLPSARALTGRIQELYQRRVVRLSPESRRLLLIAAAEPGGEPALLWRAADQLGIGITAATPAVSAGLIEINDRVRFHHPLVRSAVYWAAAPEERRRAHRVLADVTDPRTDPDRRAWHAAQGTEGTDEDIAAELESSAGRARARGGLAAAAAFLTRAVELTPAPVRRQERALVAARANHEAGTPTAALRMVSIAETGPLDAYLRGQLDLLRAQISFTVDRGGNAPGLLLKAARQLEPYDVPLARATYLEAISAGLFTGPLATGGGQLEAAEAARTAPPAQSPRPADLLLDGLTALITEGHSAGASSLQPALRAFQSPDLSEEEGMHWLWLAGTSAATLWDDEAWNALAARHIRLARESDRPTALPLALTAGIAVHLFAGELGVATALDEEVQTVSEAVGILHPPHGAMLTAAWQGREADYAELMRTVGAAATHRGEGSTLVVNGWTKALLYNSLGRYEDAQLAAGETTDRPERETSAAVGWALAEYVEAAARSGATRQAADALRRLGERTGPSGTNWGLGVEARARALVTRGPAAEDHYREAIDRLSRTRVHSELARAHLVYGEWLRRAARQRDAREQLRTAHKSFSAMGMNAFVRRAAGELLATGERALRHSAETTSALTPQEAQIVRLVREGLTNAEIGARIFISPRTVEWHLRNIFGKLGVTSRIQLQRGDPGPKG